MNGKECQECGYIHPPVKKGSCSVKKARDLSATELGKGIVKIQNKMSKILSGREDWKTILSKIDSYLNRFDNVE